MVAFPVIMALLFGVIAIASPQEYPEEVAVDADPGPPRILAYSNDAEPAEHTYRFSYETENKIRAEEHGFLKSSGAQAVEGSYSYVGADGQTYSVKYTADENGFHAEGNHLPKPPPIPEAIARSLELQATTEDYQTS